MVRCGTRGSGQNSGSAMDLEASRVHATHLQRPPLADGSPAAAHRRAERRQLARRTPLKAAVLALVALALNFIDEARHAQARAVELFAHAHVLLEALLHRARRRGARVARCHGGRRWLRTAARGAAATARRNGLAGVVRAANGSGSDVGKLRLRARRRSDRANRGRLRVPL